MFWQDARYLYGSSYYTGVSNIYRYEIETGELEAMSNAEVGFFRPLPLSDDELLVFHYTSEGFVPARIPAQTTEDLRPRFTAPAARRAPRRAMRV